MWRKNQDSKPSVQTPETAASNSKPEIIKNELPKAESLKAEGTPVTVASTGTPAAEPVAGVAAVAATTPNVVAAPVSKPSRSAPVASGQRIENRGDEDSRISSGLKIRGEITGSSDMYIDGDVQGKVRVGSGRLTVGASGRVQADLEAREIIVNGNVVGNLKAADRVQLGSTGSVQGSVVTPRIGIDDGARLR